MNLVHKSKIGIEQKNAKIASQFVEWSVKKIIGEIENCIEGELKVKNSQLSIKLEKALDNPDKIDKFTQKCGISDSEQLEYTVPVLLQSSSSKVDLKQKEGEIFTLNKLNI